MRILFQHEQDIQHDCFAHKVGRGAAWLSEGKGLRQSQPSQNWLSQSFEQNKHIVLCIKKRRGTNTAVYTLAGTQYCANLLL